MKHLVSTLEGALLDAAVAKAEGFVLRDHPGKFKLWCKPEDHRFSEAVQTGAWVTWPMAGPIIQRERISTYFQVRSWEEAGGKWVAGDNFELCEGTDWGGQTGSDSASIDLDHSAEGSSPLIAAMRSRVAAKFGEEVELP